MASLAVSNIAWEPADDGAVRELLAELGVNAVELAPTKYWPAPCNPPETAVTACRREWEAAGVRVVALQALLFGMPDLKVFGSADERLRLFAYLGTIFRV